MYKYEADVNAKAGIETNKREGQIHSPSAIDQSVNMPNILLTYKSRIMDPLVIVAIIFVFFLVMACFAFFVWFNIHRSKEKERLLLLEKGVDYHDLPGRSSLNFNWLKMGCLITSATIGLILGLTLEPYFNDASPIGMFLFGGIGLIIAHYVDKPRERP